MPAVFRIVLIYCILIALLSPSNVRALRLWDADAVVTMRDGLPCFSYPQDEEIRKRPFSFGYLDVSKPGPLGGGMWVAQTADPYNRKGLLEPNSPKTCIRYGGPHPGVKDYYDSAKPLQMDTPYTVFIGVISRSEGLYERNFLSSFCLTRDENGCTVLVDIKQDSKNGEWKCLKPREKPEKGLWERLFVK